MDREQMLNELDAGDEAPQATGTEQPQAVETGDLFDYSFGGKSYQIPANAEFAIKHNGQLVKVPASRLINGHRQSSHLETKLKDLSGRYEQYEKAVGPLDQWQQKQEQYKRLEALDKWSRDNQEKFDRIWEAMERDNNGLYGPGGAVAPEAGVAVDPNRLHSTISELKKQISELTGWKSEFEQQKFEAAVAAEAEEIDKESAEFQKKYEKFGVNLDEQDESGISLRGRIFKHAIDNDIRKFEVAALSFLGDTLFDRASAFGRQEGVKNAKGDVKAGIIGRSGIPSGQNQTVDVRKLSPDDRRKAALDELVAMNAGK